ncbi:MAG: phosphopantothenoylcysteine decarboxylase, partial [Longicatena sp.]
MMEVVQVLYATLDFIIKAAAVGDYRAQSIADNKIKKQGDTLNIEFIKNPDILAYLGEHKKNHQLLCGFAMETQDLLQNAKAKLEKKHCDMIIANNLLVEGAGFQHDTNVVTMIEKEKHTDFTRMSKYDIGVAILHRLLEIHNEKEGKGSC